MTRHMILVSSLVLAVIVVAAAPSAAADRSVLRVTRPSVVEVGRLPFGGELQRPVVEFDHARHTEALVAEGCDVCHRVDDEGFHPAFTAVEAADGRDALTDAYHDACIGCHQRRLDAGQQASGPVICGECHVRRPPAVTSRIAPAFDLSLHARHMEAYPDKCETCHHVWDEASQKLVYREDTEEACRNCHGEVAVDDTPSLADAVHRDCVGCHLERAGRAAEAGPVGCDGCHDPDQVAAIERLAEVPRLKRGQPDIAWVKSPGARLPVVPFNHALHEGQASSCSSCHHQRLKACADCHNPRPGADGGGVSLMDAHHDRRSSLSCAGCHRLAAERGDCAGCHLDTTVASLQRTGCAICHNGPDPRLEDPPPATDGALPPVTFEPLPSASDDLPEVLTIDVLADTYQGSSFPHLKIIRRFDEGIRTNPLATRFHSSPEAMCAGCHHHSPVGERPPRCGSCHGATAAPTSDAPSLMVAYHRQCLSCHQRLGLKAGCTDCHAEKEGIS